MDPKELRGLMEAYSEVYSPQQIDEISARLAGKVVNARIERTGAAADRENKYHTPQNVRDTVAAADKEARARKLAAGVRARRAANEEVEQIDELSVNKMRAYVKAAKKDRESLNKKWDQGTATTKEKMRALGHEEGEERAIKKIQQKTTKEELDIFDVVLEFLQAEGYAETLEEAEWIMSNELDDEDIEEILEAEGSYGQTPKARSAMSKLTIDRMRKPASEYSQRGEKTKKLKAAEKQTRRQDTLSRGLSGGKKSSRPWGPRGKMTADDRAEARAKAVEYGEGGTYGAGGVTKNPKKLRKQKAMGEIGESFDIFDAVLEFLYVEGYAETLEEAEWLMANVIDEEAIEIVLGEADSLAAMQIRREKRQKANMKKHGTPGFDYSKPSSGKKGYLDAITKKEEYVDEASRADDTTRANIARYAGKKGISFEPGPNWDPSANRGKGAHLNPKQKEKQRRKALRAEEYVDEAQEARNNPEKYEREQAKKSAPVRGERTPMPPRGDKRREDFEKWYRANVR
jgi:hypothetical protein